MLIHSRIEAFVSATQGGGAFSLPDYVTVPGA